MHLLKKASNNVWEVFVQIHHKRFSRIWSKIPLINYFFPNKLVFYFKIYYWRVSFHFSQFLVKLRRWDAELSALRGLSRPRKVVCFHDDLPVVLVIGRFYKILLCFHFQVMGCRCIGIRKKIILKRLSNLPQKI